MLRRLLIYVTLVPRARCYGILEGTLMMIYELRFTRALVIGAYA